MENTGFYSAQIATETSAKLFSYTLRIFKQLPRPQVRVDSIISENGICNAILRCSVEEGGETITYEWTSMGPGAAVSHVGSVLYALVTCQQPSFDLHTCALSSHSTFSLSGSKAAEGTYCPVKWIFLGNRLLLLVFLGVLRTWHIQAQVLSKPLRPNSG
uniref:Ig-like domain-containing protein n=1 Tax=Gorilla gorilla gorilla TaxID=9595 RepID=A0A2I2ZEX0_GORGO